MGVDRRSFLKLAGLSALGLGAKPALDAVLGGRAEAAVPLSAGRTWAMVVDMARCKGNCAEECIQACHQVHNVPDIRLLSGAVNKEEEVKWIWTEPFEHAFPEQNHEYLEEALKERPFVLMCNHCTNPPCVRVCPTKATWKRDDGIVMMDMHRCIGCRFCMAACPYGSRSFNWGDPRPYIRKIDPAYPTRTKGVVEKCNFCSERLARGRYPACVEACRSGALTFGDLTNPHSEVRKRLESQHTIRRKPSLGTEPNVYYIV